MQIQNIRNNQQKQNFGAIKIKGAKPGSNVMKTIKKEAEKQGKTLEFGETYFLAPRKYIQTVKDSLKENELIKALKEALSGDKKVKISSCSDLEAHKNTKRFIDNGPSITDIIF